MTAGGPQPRLLAGVAGLAVVAAALVALDRAGLSWANHGGIFGLGALVLAGTVAGTIAAKLRLPRITGYLLAGVLIGPHGLGVLSTRAVKELSLVNGLALALIALLAGLEMTTGVLARTWRSVLISSWAQILLTAVPMAAVFWWLAPRMAFTASLSPAGVVAIAAVWGVIALSRSPAVTLAVLGETGAKGPVAEHALGVVVLLDVFVLALFSFAMAGAQAAIVGAPIEIGRFVDLAGELFSSVAAGTTFGLLIALWFRFVKLERLLFVVVISYAITAFTTWFHYDTLLVFVVAGFVVMNLTRAGAELSSTSEVLSGAVMIVFFATAGAKIDFESLRDLWQVAVVLCVLRIAATIVSAKVGHVVARDAPPVRRYGFLALISQTGVSIGLATLAGEALPDVGQSFATLAIAVIGINQLLGPIAFKLALSRAGEIPPPPSNA